MDHDPFCTTCSYCTLAQNHEILQYFHKNIAMQHPGYCCRSREYCRGFIECVCRIIEYGRRIEEHSCRDMEYCRMIIKNCCRIMKHCRSGMHGKPPLWVLHYGC